MFRFLAGGAAFWTRSGAVRPRWAQRKAAEEEKVNGVIAPLYGPRRAPDRLARINLKAWRARNA
jgi:hypothetical protein